MRIDAGFFIWAVLVTVTLLLLLANLFHKGERHVLVEVPAAPSPEQDAAPVADTDAQDSETKHWCIQGLRKLGYSQVEARRIADNLPKGLTVTEALQWALRNSGSRK